MSNANNNLAEERFVVLKPPEFWKVAKKKIMMPFLFVIATDSRNVKPNRLQLSSEGRECRSPSKIPAKMKVGKFDAIFLILARAEPNVLLTLARF